MVAASLLVGGVTYWYMVAGVTHWIIPLAVLSWLIKAFMFPFKYCTVAIRYKLLIVAILTLISSTLMTALQHPRHFQARSYT